MSSQQEARTNLQELKASPGNPTLHRIFAVDLVRMFLSLITALSYMGETRVTQTVNIHGWKNAVPAGCFHFESEIKSESMNVTVSTFGAQCTVQTRKRFKQLWFYFFSSFLQLCRSHGCDNKSPQASIYGLRTYICDHCRNTAHKMDKP